MLSLAFARTFSTVALAVLLSACSSLPSPETRTQRANALAHAQGWQRSQIDAGRFLLTTYQA